MAYGVSCLASIGVLGFLAAPQPSVAGSTPTHTAKAHFIDRATDALGAVTIYTHLSGGRVERSSLLSAIRVRLRRVSPLYARYCWTSAIAMLPSPTADATRLTGLSRTSPHAKMPGALVSRRYGSRPSDQRPAFLRSSPVNT